MHIPSRLAAASLVALAAAVPASAGTEAALKRVATFEHQVTGVTVTDAGRIFVNFPRWSEDAPVSVGELVGGTVKPYPDGQWNAWRNAKPLSTNDHFVCVQSVVAHGGSLWVLDPAAPNTEHVVPGGPKLVEIDLATNTVKRAIPFDSHVAPDGSYLNDMRFAPDGGTAYMTDSGGAGAIIVVDLVKGTARRALDGQTSTQVDPTVTVTTDGKPLRRPDGRAPMFAADGIALDAKGEYLYWQALTGKTLYRIATGALRDPALDQAATSAKVETVGASEPVDGLEMDAAGRLYLTAIQANAVKVRNPAGATSILVHDDRLRWPDTMSIGPDNTLYVTTSGIQDSPWFHGTWAKKPFALYKIALPK